MSSTHRHLFNEMIQARAGTRKGKGVLTLDSYPAPRRIVVAIAEIKDGDDLVSLRRYLPEAVLLELPETIGMKESTRQIRRVLTGLDARLTSCPHPDVPRLPPRQQRILALIGDGRTNKEIGRILDLSPFTVRNHITLLFRSLNIGSRAEAVAIATRLGNEGQVQRAGDRQDR